MHSGDMSTVFIVKARFTGTTKICSKSWHKLTRHKRGPETHKNIIVKGRSFWPNILVFLHHIMILKQTSIFSAIQRCSHTCTSPLDSCRQSVRAM